MNFRAGAVELIDGWVALVYGDSKVVWQSKKRYKIQAKAIDAANKKMATVATNIFK